MFCHRQFPRNSDKNFVFDEFCQLNGTDQELCMPAGKKRKKEEKLLFIPTIPCDSLALIV